MCNPEHIWHQVLFPDYCNKHPCDEDNDNHVDLGEIGCKGPRLETCADKIHRPPGWARRITFLSPHMWRCGSENNFFKLSFPSDLGMEENNSRIPTTWAFPLVETIRTLEFLMNNFFKPLKISLTQIRQSQTLWWMFPGILQNVRPLLVLKSH